MLITPHPEGQYDILVASSDLQDHGVIRAQAYVNGWVTRHAESVHEALHELDQHRFAAVLVDCELDGGGWREWLETGRDLAPWTCWVVVCPHAPRSLWPEVTLHGGHDLIGRPWHNVVVEHLVERARWKLLQPVSAHHAALALSAR